MTPRLLVGAGGRRSDTAAGNPVRVRGVVRTAGRGLPRVSVSDGYDVVRTASDGTFELITTDERPFVTVSVPAGYELPVTGTGTAAGYVRVNGHQGGELDATFDLDRLASSDDRHTMLLLPDIQTEDAQEMAWFHEQSIPDVRDTIRAVGEQPVFGIACGDIMFDHLELYGEYEQGIAQLGVPFLQVVGNHDLDQDQVTDETSTSTFSRHFGPAYRSFDRGAVHYVVLDDVFWHGTGYLGYLSETQLTWLANDLRYVEPGRVVIVALHIPVLGSGHTRRGQASPGLAVSVANREALYRLLEPYRAHVVCGHTHESDHGFHHGLHEHVSGTVCGAWWSGPICADGTPNGYAVYEIDGESVRWRYKATGLPRDHQIRVYPRGADPAAPMEIVANIWDWDPSWTVVWYAGGIRRGAMARRTGLDPLSVELHTGPELPPRRKWVEPYPTSHLFYAPVDEPGTMTVEATDRWGRTYTATVASD